MNESQQQRNSYYGRGRGHGGRQQGKRKWRRGGGGRGGRSRNNYDHNNNNNHNGRNTTHQEFSVHDEIINVEEVGTFETKHKTVRIAVQGCCHGSIERIYDMLEACEQRDDKKIDLLICCGDFQALRNTTDFETMAVPMKYRDIGTFHKYYSGVKKAPILTVFVGGNHEASSYLQELYYGGWVAPNIYYLGAVGVVRFRGLRISGASGIYKEWDYRKGRNEFPPYNNATLRSVYHIRNVEVARLKCLTRSLGGTPVSGKCSASKEEASLTDIMISHDWPRGVEQHGDLKALLRKKRHFKDEVNQNSLGSPANEDLLNTLKPEWWFAAHLHVKFMATYKHAMPTAQSEVKLSSDDTTSPPPPPPPFKEESTSGPALEKKNDDDQSQDQLQESSNEEFIPLPKEKSDTANLQTSFVGLESSKECVDGDDLTDLMTKFLSLDKCLPRKRHLQIVNVPCPDANKETDESSSFSSSTPAATTSSPKASLHYDLEWLAILQKTNSWLSCHNTMIPDPDVSSVIIDKTDIENIEQRLKERHESTRIQEDSCSFLHHTQIPNNFTLTLQPHGTIGSNEIFNGGKMVGNPQTDELVNLLGLNHIVTVPYMLSSTSMQTHSSPEDIHEDRVKDTNEIDIDEEENDVGTSDRDSNEIDIDVMDDENEKVRDNDDENEIDIDI